MAEENHEEPLEIVEGEIEGAEEKEPRPTPLQAFHTRLGELAQAAAVLIFLLLLEAVIDYIARRTGQVKKPIIHFLLENATFFTVWGVIVVAGFEFLSLVVGAFFSFVGRLIDGIIQLRGKK